MNRPTDLWNGDQTASKSASRFASTDVQLLYTRTSATVHRDYENIPAKSTFPTEARVGDSDPRLHLQLREQQGVGVSVRTKFQNKWRFGLGCEVTPKQRFG
jgi:hypothetical protein